MRNLQRLLNALLRVRSPYRCQFHSQSIPVVSDKVQRSNIVAVSVSPDISRKDRDRTPASRRLFPWPGLVGRDDNVRDFLLVPFSHPSDVDREKTRSGILCLNSPLRIPTKSPTFALQSTLHSLFLPTLLKSLTVSLNDPKQRASDSEEVLKPVAVAECAVAPVRMRPPHTSGGSCQGEGRRG
ncbi:hypothetical protein BC827DRAFT_862006 [Russula dissimulans]|nr:hypothetical protein BC827DRAFT_862006 [Russula dissimulans]